MRFLMVATTAAALLASPANAVAGNSFCTDLNAVTNEAANGFLSLRGAQLEANQNASAEHPLTTYAAKRSLAGAVRCEADHMANNGSASDFYACVFAPTPTKLAKVQEVGGAIADCLGGIQPDDDVDFEEANDTGEINLVRATFEINILAADTQALVRLTITGK
jgi:hypothetical protein